MKRQHAIFLILTVLLSGCSSKILMPYEEDFTCSRSQEGGMCGSMTEIYKKSYNDAKPSPKATGDKQASTMLPVNGASLIDNEQNEILSALWRISKAQGERIEKLEKTVSTEQNKNHLMASMFASVAGKLTNNEKQDNKFKFTTDISPDDNNVSAITPTVDKNTTASLSNSERINSKARQKTKKYPVGTCKDIGLCVATKNVYIRAEPSVSAKKIRLIDKGTKLEIVELKKRWNKTAEGWVHGGYLRKAKDSEINTSVQKKVVPFVSESNKTDLKKRDANASAK